MSQTGLSGWPTAAGRGAIDATLEETDGRA